MIITEQCSVVKTLFEHEGHESKKDTKEKSFVSFSHFVLSCSNFWAVLKWGNLLANAWLTNF
jgi:hypothetical protein